MKLSEVPIESKYLDVDGNAVVKLPTGVHIAFTTGKGDDVESRPYPSHAKASAEGDTLTRFEFASWLKTGKNRFDVHSS